MILAHKERLASRFSGFESLYDSTALGTREKTIATNVTNNPLPVRDPTNDADKNKEQYKQHNISHSVEESPQ